MTTSTTWQERVRASAKSLVERLEALREDRGAMANLRRGFSPATEDRAWPWIARWCDLTKDHQRLIYTAVAAAYATHPETTDQGNLGTVMRSIAQNDQKRQNEQKGDDGLASFEARFRRLLACQSLEQVCQRLASVIRAATQRGVPVNYEQLFVDLWKWRYPTSRERVKVDWAAAYWTGREQGETP